RRAVALSDPRTGRHVEVVVADGVVVGATCVGDARTAADLTTAYTRRTPVPADPAHLLLSPVRGAAAPTSEPSPTLMPDRATVCRCNGVTKGEIVACWHDGARDVAAVARRTRATTGCGGCTDAVCGIVDWLARSDVGEEPERTGEGARAATAHRPVTVRG
ncbi:(2Fe-2S)-binding protein, partial [Actinotalea ferrariae]|uniref:(2Fe-2S)-binding protein n=1 Tax=Actinotalea ferrariae TaxID=1386098 RepID=UPI000558C012